jgi:hypothetical protein
MRPDDARHELGFENVAEHREGSFFLEQPRGDEGATHGEHFGDKLQSAFSTRRRSETLTSEPKVGLGVDASGHASRLYVAIGAMLCRASGFDRIRRRDFRCGAVHSMPLRLLLADQTQRDEVNDARSVAR